MSTVNFGVRTDVGSHRDLNEDAVYAAPPIFAVADGMGGHAAGEVAAGLAIEQLGTLAGRANVQPDDVRSAIGDANRSIVARQDDEAETAGMGTTITGVCLGSVGGAPHWLVFNVGDSRVYRYVNGLLQQVTTDHSEVAELVAAGLISPGEARRHPNRNVITRSLGMTPPPETDIWVLPVVEGERFLVCSDGLPSEVPDSVIAALLGHVRNPQEAADALVAEAVAAGGHDNISVIVVEVADSGRVREAEVATAPRQRLSEGI